jgi:cation transport regulator ChaC
MSSQWIFGYGSLVWRPAFAYLEKAPAYVEGWTRRFWQASPDHRGTEASPGRVVTLVPSEGERCWGMAYRVSALVANATLAALDHREKAGYERVLARLTLADGKTVDEVLFYVAAEGNPNFIGEQDDEAIVSVIRSAHGPSGSNREYLLRLAQALAAMEVEDQHIAGLVKLL